MSYEKVRKPSIGLAALEQKKSNAREFRTQLSAKDENQTRGNWSNPLEFLLSCLGYIVGLGNIWRFPYLVYQNGGGAFFIPYLLMLLFCGLPMVLMELTLGQYWSQGCLTVWKLAPLFKGVGMSMVLICFFCCVYYCMITGWALYYLLHSLTAHLPWACCDPSWATGDCHSFMDAQSCGINISEPNTTVHVWTNISKFAADEYFHNAVLRVSEGLPYVGDLQWRMVLALAVAWVICFLVLIKGVKSLGKFSYVTSTLPYLVLFTLLIGAAIQPGSTDGMLFYITPQWHLLKHAKVWSDASTQIFYSTGVCFGCQISLASYNKFNHNIYRDALFLAVGNSLTSILSGFVVFSILGFMAHSQNTTVDMIVTQGPGLTFIAYPQAVTLLGASPVWSTLFFIMLTLLALSSMFPMVETVITAVVDQFPTVFAPYKSFVTLGVCIFSFFAGLILTSNGGIYILQLFDNYAVGYALLFAGLVEVTVVAWRYGAWRLVANLRSMVGEKRGFFFFKYVWMIVTPTFLCFSIIFTLSQAKAVEYGDYKFPVWGTAIGWCFTFVSISPIPIYAIFKFISHKRTREGQDMTFIQSIDFLTLPNDKLISSYVPPPEAVPLKPVELSYP